MAETPRPGTAAAFKARHAAYQSVASLREAVQAERNMDWYGGPEERDAAGGAARALAATVLATPEARQILAADPPLFQAVQQHQHAISAQVARDLDLTPEREADLDTDQAPDRDLVQWIQSSEWMGHDGLWESRIHLGQSEAGWHYDVETSYQGEDGGAARWSAALASREEAEAAAWEAHEAVMRPHEEAAQRREAAQIARFEHAEADRMRRIGAHTRDEGLER